MGKKTLRLPFKGPIEGFAVNYTKKNEWRLHGHVPISDVLADAYKIYAECLDRYGGVVDTPEWFMSLFKRSFINYFHAVSIRASALNNVSSLEEIQRNDPDLSHTMGVASNLGELIVKVAQAPSDVKKVISFLLSNSEQCVAFENAWRDQGKKKVGGNEYLCRALGYNPRKVDLVSMVHKYFIDDTEDDL